MKKINFKYQVAAGVILIVGGTLALLSNYIKEKRDVVFSEMNLTLSSMLTEQVEIDNNVEEITEENNEELEGAYLELRNESGELVEAWVSGKEPHKIEDLEPGKYTLSETIAPEGYELTTETVEFIVKEDGTVDGDIIMYNKPETIVEVPATASFKTITASIIVIIIIGLGSLIIYKNYKKNEEN